MHKKNNNSARRWEFVCMQNNPIAAHLCLAIFEFTISSAMNSKARVRIQGEFYITHSYTSIINIPITTPKKRHFSETFHTQSETEKKKRERERESTQIQCEKIH